MTLLPGVKLDVIKGTGVSIDMENEFRLLTLQVIGEAILSLSPAAGWSLNSVSGLVSNGSRSTNQIAPMQTENTHCTRYTTGADSLSANHAASYKGNRSPLHWTSTRLTVSQRTESTLQHVHPP